MAFWNRHNKEIGSEAAGLSLNQEAKTEVPKPVEAESKRSGAERINEVRKNTWSAIKGGVKRFIGLGEKLGGAFDRVAGKGLEVAEATPGAVKKGAEAVGSVAKKGAEAYGSAMQAVGEVPDWLLDQAGDVMNKGVETAKATGQYMGEKTVAGTKAVGRGIKTTAEVAAGVGIVAVVGAYEGGKYLSGKAVEGSKFVGGKVKEGAEAAGRAYVSSKEATAEAMMATVDWAEKKADQGTEWVGKKYEGLKGWAGEQVDSIQAKGRAASERFDKGVKSAVEWKNNTVNSFKGFLKEKRGDFLQWRLEAHESKRDAIEAKLKELRGIADLHVDIAA